MGKLAVTMWLTLDGMAAGPDGEIDWILGDKQLSDYELRVVEQADTLLFGRKTYDDFANYWPSVPQNPQAMEWEKTHAENMNTRNKIVISSSDINPTWVNTTSIKDLTPEAINTIKAKSDSYVLIYGSLSIVQQLTELKLIDEYQLLIHPLILGLGKPLFANIKHRHKLKLASTQTFDSGILLSTYLKA